MIRKTEKKQIRARIHKRIRRKLTGSAERPRLAVFRSVAHIYAQVIDDPQAKVVGYGVGKAKEVPSAIRKGIEAAKKNLRRVHVLETTIAHQVLGVFASSHVLLKPAPAGTGVIAGGAVRAVITACGVPNVLTKSIGRRNPHNVVKATIVALESLRDRAAVAEARGLALE